MFLRYSVAAALYLQFTAPTRNVISHVKHVMYFYISTYRSKCAVPNMAVFCSSLISYFPGQLPRYCLSDYETVPAAPTITAITFTCTVPVPLAVLLLDRLYILESSQRLSGPHLCPQEQQRLSTRMVVIRYHELRCPVYC
jgi:hypothetical protein